MFRFTIREIVLLTVIVAMGVGWIIDHDQLAGAAAGTAIEAAIWRNKHDRVVESLALNGWEVEWESIDGADVAVCRPVGPPASATNNAP